MRSSVQMTNKMLCILYHFCILKLFGIIVLIMLWVLCKHCKDTVVFQLFLMIVFLILFSERQIASGLGFAWRNYIIS